GGSLAPLQLVGLARPDQVGHLLDVLARLRADRPNRVAGKDMEAPRDSAGRLREAGHQSPSLGPYISQSASIMASRTLGGSSGCHFPSTGPSFNRALAAGKASTRSAIAVSGAHSRHLHSWWVFGCSCL